MKTAGTFVFLALASFCCFSGVASKDINKLLQDECMEFWPLLRSGHFYCNRDNNPVRGPDGETHTNKCVMCRKMMASQVNNGLTGQGGNVNRSPTITDDCSEYRSQIDANGDLTCTKENDPVRDSSGRQHSNKCLMCAEKFKQEAQRGIHFGRNTQQPTVNSLHGKSTNQNSCSQSGGTSPCSANGQAAQGNSGLNGGCGGVQQGTAPYGGDCGTQSGSNGRANQGVGNGIIIPVDCRRILHGIKGEAILCRNSWEPICGTDGKTYSNRCVLCSEMRRTGNGITVMSEGECANAAPAKANCSQYPQTKGRVLCTRSSQMVCGTDGVTHSSECMLCDRILKTRSEIGIKHIGACAQK
ncbi:serine protease inhibitor Kazal-type 5-like [Trachemys scripta elegans]|uniref:serine protease inhibitor Kazal-type 5-like n=1 Tax=Trachemys scripta elegans TaxID=31138 RepID=UPI0015554B1C|nr:serine protease inhibitor Kazal-type 5-like [Trachemys scripta elegans]